MSAKPAIRFFVETQCLRLTILRLAMLVPLRLIISLTKLFSPFIFFPYPEIAVVEIDNEDEDIEQIKNIKKGQRLILPFEYDNERLSQCE